MTPEGVVLDSIVISDDTLVQASPSIAFGNGIYLVCWADNRAGFSDIYYARVLPDGSVLDIGFPIHPDSALQLSANVAFDGNNFFVVWTAYENGGFNLCGARIAVNGTVLDSTPIAISIGDVSKFRPGISFDGSNYMVIWDDARLSAPEYDQWAARITPDGIVIDTNGIPIDTSTGNQLNSSITFLNHLYFATWADFGSGNADIYGRRISPFGYVIDTAAVAICTQTGDQEQPFVSCNTERFIIAWKDARLGVANSDIYADFVDSGAVGIEGKIQPISCSKRLLVYSSPNPFTKTVKIRVFSSENRKVYTTLSIYDVCGRLVKHFPVIQFPYYQVIWDGMNEKGDRVSPGVYFCVLRVADKQTTHVLLHVK